MGNLYTNGQIFHFFIVKILFQCIFLSLLEKTKPSFFACRAIKLYKFDFLGI